MHTICYERDNGVRHKTTFNTTHTERYTTSYASQWLMNEECMFDANLCSARRLGRARAVECDGHTLAYYAKISHHVRRSRSTGFHHGTAINTIRYFICMSEFYIFVAARTHAAEIESLAQRRDGWLQGYHIASMIYRIRWWRGVEAGRALCFICWLDGMCEMLLSTICLGQQLPTLTMLTGWVSNIIETIQDPFPLGNVCKRNIWQSHEIIFIFCKYYNIFNIV